MAFLQRHQQRLLKIQLKVTPGSTPSPDRFTFTMIPFGLSPRQATLVLPVQLAQQGNKAQWVFKVLKVQQDHVAQQVHLETPGQQVPLVQQGQSDYQDHRDQQDRKDLLDHKENVETLAHKVTLDLQETRDLPVLKDLPAQVVHRDQLVRLVLEDSLVRQVHKGQPVQQAQALLEVLDRPGQPVHQVDQLGPQALPEQLALQVNKVFVEQQARRAQRDQQVQHRLSLDRKGRQVHKEHQLISRAQCLQPQLFHH
jgi:hypothetical protein